MRKNWKIACKKKKKKKRNKVLHDGGSYLMLCKSMEWFLYDRDIYHERIKLVTCSLVQITWTQVLCRFKSCSRCVGDLQWWWSLTIAPVGNKAKRLSYHKNNTAIYNMTATIPQKQFITIIIKIEIFESSSYRCCVFKLVELGDYKNSSIRYLKLALK